MADLDSEIFAFGENNKKQLVGFESYETYDNILATLGILEVDTNCLE